MTLPAVEGDIAQSDRELLTAIERSWHRSATCGVDQSRTIEDLEVHAFDPEVRLLTAADVVLGQMMQDLGGAPFAVLLADREGLIVDARTPNMQGTMADLVVSRIGRQCTEETAGTNSIGTALELSRPIRIRGEEHYLQSLWDFDCLGIPISNPVSGRIEGVLSLCGARNTLSPALSPFLAYAARDIQKQLRSAAPRGHLDLLSAFQAASRHRSAVVVLGADLVLATPTATAMLGPLDHAMLRQVATGLRQEQVRRVEIDLESGQRALLAIRRCGNERQGGILAEIEAPILNARAKIPRGTNASLPVRGTVARDLDLARRARACTLITGEPGTGRTHALAKLAGDARLLLIDCVAAPPSAPDRLVAALSEAERVDKAGMGPGTLVALDGIEALSRTDARRIHELLAGASAWTALAGPPLDAVVGEQAALIALCRNHVHLPPLRARALELPALIDEVTTSVTQSAGRPALRWSPEAVNALVAHSWPGNLRELSVVVEQVLRDAADGVPVPASALPSSVGSAPRRRLNPLQRSEREVIAATLRACSGNKVHAATELGISRSTLYKRMRELDLPDI